MRLLTQLIATLAVGTVLGVMAAPAPLKPIDEVGDLQSYGDRASYGKRDAEAEAMRVDHLQCYGDAACYGKRDANASPEQ